MLHRQYILTPIALTFLICMLLPACSVSDLQPDVIGDDVTIAICQTLCMDSDREKNMARIEEALNQAKQKGADIACLPETAILGWVNPRAHELAYPIPGKDTDALAKLAQKYNLWICCGLSEKGNGKGEEGKLYDTVVLIDSQGDLKLKHRKINILTRLMTPPYTKGEHIDTIKTPFGTIGLLVCADSFKEELLESMAKLKPDLVLIPYGWAAPEDNWPDHGLSLAKTVSHAAGVVKATVVGTDVVGKITNGPWKGYIYGGQSVAADSECNILVRCADRKPDVKIIKLKINRNKR